MRVINAVNAAKSQQKQPAIHNTLVAYAMGTVITALIGMVNGDA